MTCDLFIVSAYLVIIRPIMFTVEQWGVDKREEGERRGSRTQLHFNGNSKFSLKSPGL